MSRIERAAATAWTRVGKLWLGLESFFVAYPTGMDDTAPGSISSNPLWDDQIVSCDWTEHGEPIVGPLPLYELRGDGAK
jgi:hypothetical protein